MSQQESYFPATRHPWPCFLFLLPLLVLYEAGVLVLGGMHPETLRNGADNWLRWGLGSMGVETHFIAPVVLLLGFGIWSVRRREDRPRELFNVLTGMIHFRWPRQQQSGVSVSSLPVLTAPAKQPLLENFCSKIPA